MRHKCIGFNEVHVSATVSLSTTFSLYIKHVPLIVPVTVIYAAHVAIKNEYANDAKAPCTQPDMG